MLSDIIRSQLIQRSVGNNMENEDGDVRRVKNALSQVVFGFLEQAE